MPDYAAASRFGGIIASGPHYVSLLLGLPATTSRNMARKWV